MQIAAAARQRFLIEVSASEGADAGVFLTVALEAD